jgi:hypothetical protein
VKLKLLARTLPGKEKKKYYEQGRIRIPRETVDKSSIELCWWIAGHVLITAPMIVSDAMLNDDPLLSDDEGRVRRLVRPWRGSRERKQMCCHVVLCSSCLCF